jgi:hypothetical protein
MRVFSTLFLALALLVMVGVAAQDHGNDTEKKAADEISIAQAVKVGDKVLPAGRYRISCDRANITFERLAGKHEKTEFACKGKELGQKVSSTELHLNMQGSDAVVTRLLLRGSNIEHTF